MQMEIDLKYYHSARIFRNKRIQEARAPVNLFTAIARDRTDHGIAL
jgi:hypothetical protein